MSDVALPAVVAITDPTWSDDDLAERTRRMLEAVPRSSVGIQLRDRVRSTTAVFALARRLAAICAETDAPLYVNDRLDIALALDAAGAHLGGWSVSVADARRLLDGAFVSVAAHAPDDVARAAADGASAALVSPIFATPGKGPPRGTSLLTEARSRAPGFPIYALGGIDARTAAQCVRAGADGVAVVRAVWQASDPGAAAMSLVAAVREHAAPRKDDR